MNLNFKYDEHIHLNYDSGRVFVFCGHRFLGFFAERGENQQIGTFYPDSELEGFAAGVLAAVEVMSAPKEDGKDMPAAVEAIS